MFGGSDVSDLFLKRSQNKLEMFDLKSFSEFGKSHDLHWWNDPTCVVGGITKQERHICVRNKSKGIGFNRAKLDLVLKINTAMKQKRKKFVC